MLARANRARAVFSLLTCERAKWRDGPEINPLRNMRHLIITRSLKRPKLFCENFVKPLKVLHLLPCADAVCIWFRNVSGAIISSHCITTTVIGWIRRTGTCSVFFSGLYDALRPFIAFMNAVPIFAQPCLRSFFRGCRFFFRTVFSSLVCHCII